MYFLIQSLTDFVRPERIVVQIKNNWGYGDGKETQKNYNFFFLS